MKTRHFACLATLALIAACSSGGDEEPQNKTKEELVQEAINVASEPFSIGDEAEQQMGSAPPNPMVDNSAGEITSQ